tara:strand:+ start:377 stop:556 length:180 start_codon:yes stop_codon:yes gene_type:complete
MRLINTAISTAFALITFGEVINTSNAFASSTRINNIIPAEVLTDNSDETLISILRLVLF